MPPSQTVLPRWMGFNLLEAFTTRSSGDFQEDDFRWMAEWGFNFARLPACYTLWIQDDDPYQPYEPMLEKLDRVVALGQKYGVHIDLNFHRGPGYSVNQERQEPFNLWQDQAALDAFIFHWQMFALRYHGIPSSQLSFNLINEPAHINPRVMTRADHERVIRATVAAIREIDPERLILVDGLEYGNVPLPELADLASQNVAQSCRAYLPFHLTHYKAGWVKSQGWPEPAYPGELDGGQFWDRQRLEAHYQKWADLAAQGVGVHCGEGGAYAYTPHAVVLAWLGDVLEVLRGLGIGFALWNLRGSFGVLDSGRTDVAYEVWHGHQLDRQMLELLRAFC